MNWSSSAGQARRSRRSSSRVELVEHLAAERVQAQVELEEDVLLALEVVVERRLRDAEPLGDLAQRGLVVALLVEELEGDVEDPLARLAAGPAGTCSVCSMTRILLDGRQVSDYARESYLPTGKEMAMPPRYR